MQEINIEGIRKILPHSYPFLFVDRVTDYELEKFIIGYKNVTFNENFFTGHFPDKAVFPGVIIVEALAQISGVLAGKSLEYTSGKIFYLASVNNVKFKKVVVPGDKLILQSNVVSMKRSMWKFSCVASVDGVDCCIAEMIIAQG